MIAWLGFNGTFGTNNVQQSLFFVQKWAVIIRTGFLWLVRWQSDIDSWTPGNNCQHHVTSNAQHQWLDPCHAHALVHDKSVNGHHKLNEFVTFVDFRQHWQTVKNRRVCVRVWQTQNSCLQHDCVINGMQTVAEVSGHWTVCSRNHLLSAVNWTTLEQTGLRPLTLQWHSRTVKCHYKLIHNSVKLHAATRTSIQPEQKVFSKYCHNDVEPHF